MRFRVFFFLFGFFAFASLSSAQSQSPRASRGSVEISPFGGYLFGGEFARGTNALFNFDVDAEDEATYGVRLGFDLTRNVQIELQASRTETFFVTGDNDVLFGNRGRTRLADLRIDYLMAYGTFQFGGRRRVVPYLTVGAGVAQLDPGPRRDIVCVRPGPPCNDPGSETRFTASLGAGLKTYFTPHFGLRFDARGYATSLRDNDGDDLGCGFFDNCDDRDYLANGELSGGLIFRF